MNNIGSAKFVRKSLKRFLMTLVACVVPFFCSMASADIITWQASENLFQGTTTQSFISTNGTLAVAYNNTLTSNDAFFDDLAPAPDITFVSGNVNTALVGITGESITINGGTDNNSAFADGEFSGDAEIQDLLQSGTFGVNSVTLGNLQANTIYEIQIFSNDARGGASSRDLNTLLGLGDGTGVSAPVASLESNNSPLDDADGNNVAATFPETEAGDYIIGTFTSTGANVTFNAFGSGNGGATFTQGAGQSLINGIQLRAIGTIPEPGAGVLLLGGLLMGIAKRRRK